MFNFCCFGRKSQKGVKNLQIYNRNYRFKQSQQIQLLGKKNESKIQSIVRKLPVLASAPISDRSLNSKRLNSLQIEDHPKKTILKSQYDQLIEFYRKKNQSWEDPDFPPNNKSWGQPNRTVIWKRVVDAIPNAKFVQNNFSPFDILQGATGDCYFLSAIAGLAENPERIVKIFPNTSLNKNGIYMARLLHKGVFQEVVVDDYFPFSPKGQLLSAKPAGGNQIWVMILEKCWAKLYGSYKNIQGGFPEQVLRAISAAPTYHFEMTEKQIASGPDYLEKIWQRMIRSQQKRYIICAGSISQSIQNIDKLGLINGHAYTVLSVYDQPERLVKLRNPWGHKQWTGRASEQDKNFWSKVRQDLKVSIGFYEQKGDDGVFFMLWEDFTNYFNIIDFCNYEDNSHYYFHEQNYKKQVPVFYDVQTKGGMVTFMLSQASSRQKKLQQQIDNIQFDETTFILAKINPQGVTYVESAASNTLSDFCFKFMDLPAARYVLISFVDGKQTSSQATLSVYSEKSIKFEKSNVYAFDFVKKVILQAASENPEKNILNENPLQWISVGFIPECKIGYTAFHLSFNSQSNLDAEFDEREYITSPFTLFPEFRGKGKFKIVCNKGEQAIVVSKIYAYEKDSASGGGYPSAKIKRIR